MTTQLTARPTGQMLIAGNPVAGTGTEIRGFNPATGQTLEPAYRYGDEAHVDGACAAAAEAFGPYRATTSEQRARFLETVAASIEAIKTELVERAVAESGLPEPRIAGEVGRTTGQLRRPDIRQREVPLGPVAVFGASNFPLAFSVAGGDTASALAAGCPVVVKAHDAHPGTSELVGAAIARAVAQSGMPAGTFSLLFGSGPGLGVALVADPRIKAVGFTGSRFAGMALVATAAARPEPILLHCILQLPALGPERSP